MNLTEYRTQAGLSQSEFGTRMDPPVTAGLVSQWECGTTRITLPYALQIQRISDDQVSPQDCADMYVEPDLRTAHQEKPSV